ncbi:MAG: hypothetical protein ACXWDO_04950 [Bacteroidia bacterium]
MIKLNMRPLPFGEISLPDVVAVSYETIHGCEVDVCADSPIHDFNIALYKEDRLMNWVQLCPCEDSGKIEFRNRYINEGDACSEINEKILRFAEKWAIKHGYEKIMVRACDASIAYYLRMKYIQEGAPVPEKGNLLYPMIKTL